MCSSYALAEVAAVHLHFAAHLVQTRAHAFADSVSQRLVAGSPRRRKVAALNRPAWRQVGEVGRDDRSSLVVVTSVEDVTDSVPHPLGRLHCSEFVEDKHLSVKDRPENFQLRGLHAGIVGILNLFQQLAVVVKKARRVLLYNQLAKDADCQVCLTHPDRTEQHEAGGLDWIFFDKPVRLKQSIGQTTGGAGEVRIEVRERAVFVTRRNARLFQQPVRPIAHPTIATDDAFGFRRGRWKCFPS